MVCRCAFTSGLSQENLAEDYRHWEHALVDMAGQQHATDCDEVTQHLDQGCVALDRVNTEHATALQVHALTVNILLELQSHTSMLSVELMVH
jgi:hypothetical protein